MIEDRMMELTTVHKQVKELIEESRRRMKTTADKRRRDVDTAIVVGSKVWLNLEGIGMNRFNLRPCPKLNPRYFGPFKVLSQPGVTRYRLQLPDDCAIHDTFSSDRLKPYLDPEMVKYKGKTLKLGSDFTQNDERRYVVKKILDHDVIRKKIWYLVHWDGYDEVHESTWESRERLYADAKKIVVAYDKLHGVKSTDASKQKRSCYDIFVTLTQSYTSSSCWNGTT
eukprot:SAG31_NODE_3703_length_3974_cov_7.925161_5_plen_225_part_00